MCWICGIWSLKCCERLKEYKKTTQASTRETGVVLRGTPKVEHVLDQNVDLSNVDQVPSNAHLSEKESRLYNFEDNEAVIKMIIKGQKPDNETRIPYPPSSAWVVIWQNKFGWEIQIKYVESMNQLADILTKAISRGMSGAVCCIFLNIMNDTTFSCSHLPNNHPSIWDVEEISGNSSPNSPKVKARACCLVLRHSVSVLQNPSSNLKRLGNPTYSQEWNQGERSTNSGSCSVQPRETVS